MTQKGEHSWDLHIRYHRCPQCGFILESREDYTYRMGQYIKELSCDRCKRQFVEIKKTTPTFGPLIGTPQPPEVEWSQWNG